MICENIFYSSWNFSYFFGNCFILLSILYFQNCLIILKHWELVDNFEILFIVFGNWFVAFWGTVWQFLVIVLHFLGTKLKFFLNGLVTYGQVMAAGQKRLGQVRLDHLKLDHVKLGQVKLGQVKLGHVRLGNVRLGQTRLCQVRLISVRLRLS